jgi:hypothetical protein
LVNIAFIFQRSGFKKDWFPYTWYLNSVCNYNYNKIIRFTGITITTHSVNLKKPAESIYSIILDSGAVSCLLAAEFVVRFPRCGGDKLKG